MERCKDYEVELSALLDGESDPATAVEILDHVIQCSSCREFYAELRSFQSLVDDMSLESTPDTDTVTAPPRKRRFGWLGGVPRLAWGAAAVLVITVGLWMVGPFDRTNVTSLDPSGGDVAIQLEENKGSMDEQRFVELASELLRADRRYQQEMYQILTQVGQTGDTGESPVLEARSENERGESTGEFFALVGGPPVLD